MGRLARGASVIFTGKLGGVAILYGTQLLLAWSLGAAGFGIFTLGMGLYQLTELFATLGLTMGSVRFISTFRRLGDDAGIKGVLFDTFRLPLLVGTVLAAVIFIVAPYLSVAVFEEPSLATPLRILAVGIPLGAVMNALAFATTGFQTTRYLVWIIYIIFPICNITLLALLLPGGIGLVGAAIAWTASLGISAFAGAIMTARLWPRIWDHSLKSRFETYQLVKVSLPLVAGDFLWVALIWVDVLMLGIFAAAESVGIYRAASQTALLLSIVGFALSSILAPISADLHAGGEHRALRHTYRVSARWQVTAVLPLFVVMLLAGSDILRIFGPDFAAGHTALVVLAGAQLVCAFTGGGGAVLVMLGHQILKLYTDVAAAVLNVVLNFILIPKFGIMGAAIATGTSIASAFLLRTVMLAWKERLSPLSMLLMRPVAAGVGAIFSGWLASSAGVDLPALRLLLIVGAVTAAYVATLFAIGLPTEERQLLARIQVPFRGTQP
ncbi:MAG: flippase [Pseudomonadota bacterium]|nr:flippase [Pseudomonadota bacterium]